ncbi:MAG: hypothetical protein ACOCQ5_03295 [Halanaerobiales bacterium]
MFKKSILFMLYLILLILFYSSVISAAGVRPLVLNFDLKPGASSEFELLLTPGSVRENIELSLYYPIQQLNGNLSYEEGDPVKHQVLNWIKLDETEVVVPAGEEKLVRGEVKVPYGASGTHTAVIMIEPVEDEDSNNKNLFSFKVRYAVRININIDRPGQRVKMDLLDFDLRPDGENNPVLWTHIKNPSPLHYNASGEVTIRDENRKLIERVEISTKAAARAGRAATRIYPKSELIFEGKVQEPLFPGNYDLQLFMKYAEGRQLIERKWVTVGEEYMSDKIRYLGIEPEIISDDIYPGAAVSEVIQCKNSSSEPIIVRLNQKEIEPEYKYSIFNTGKFQLRGEEEFTLEPRDSKRIVMIYRSPREITHGGYYGQLEMSVFDQNKKELETRTLDLEVVIGDDWEYRADILDLTSYYQDEEQLFSVSIKNLSPVHLIPRGEIKLKDSEDIIIKTIPLELQEGVRSILPDTTGYLVNNTRNLEPGEYTAEVLVRYQNQELEKAEFPVIIE